MVVQCPSLQRPSLLPQWGQTAQEPQRGGLFVVTPLAWDGPNPSGVTCRAALFLGFNRELRASQKATPLGFLSGSHQRGQAQPSAAADAGGTSVGVLRASGPARLRWSFAITGYV